MHRGTRGISIFQCVEICISRIVNIGEGVFSEARRRLSRSSPAQTIDLFRSTTNCTYVRAEDATRNEKESARAGRARSHATSFFRRARRHLRLVRPSPFYFSRCARTTPSCDTANCHGVTFPGPPLTSVSYACVRACVREQMF